MIIISLLPPPFPSSPLPSSLPGDEIRRVVMECVIPMVTASCAKKKLDVCNHGDVFLSQYDQFDDYLEMVIQFGVCA